MHVVTVTFEQIEHASRDAVRFHRFLHLTFRATDGSRHWWSVPGWPAVWQGMSVTAVLANAFAPGTNRVLGWKCNATGELLVAQSPWTPAFGAACFVACGALAARLYYLSPEQSSLTSPLPAVAFLALAVAFAGQSYKAAKVFRTLRAVSSD